jgi:hypothetical protein
VGITEAIGPTTNYRTIIEGNADKSGARMTRGDEYAHIVIGVQGQPGLGAPGRFKAVYRAFWSAAAPDFRSSVAPACLDLAEDVRLLSEALIVTQGDLNDASTGGKPAIVRRIKAQQQRLVARERALAECVAVNP